MRVTELLARFAEASPGTINSWENGCCFYCGEDDNYNRGLEHDPACLWIEARRKLNLPVPVIFDDRAEWHRVGPAPECPTCEGDGWPDEEPCWRCKGNGMLSDGVPVVASNPLLAPPSPVCDPGPRTAEGAP